MTLSLAQLCEKKPAGDFRIVVGSRERFTRSDPCMKKH